MEVTDRGARFILEQLEQQGYEASAVGGCVRDLLRGEDPHDWDITTSARPEEVLKVFAGEQVLTTGLRHGTAAVLLDGNPYEVTTYRADGTYTDGRRPDAVVFVSALEEDLARRDFTVNAMALDRHGVLHDPFGGQADLQHKVLRCVGEPERRFREDGLRLMRALRFAATLKFSIHPDTARALHTCRDMLTHVAGERIQAELFRLLPGPGAGAVLRAFPDVLAVFWPELAPLPGFDQRSPWHCYDLWEHTVRAVENVPPTIPLRLAALLHDVGKPACFSVDESGTGHFYGHPAVSARLADEMLRRLHTSNALREEVVSLVERHHWDLPPTEAVVRRRLRQLGPEGFSALLALQRADLHGQAGDIAAPRLAELDRTEALARDILAQRPCLSLKELALSGKDVLALGVSPGPAVGEILKALLDRVAEGELPNTREALLPAARELAKEFGYPL
ncbi:hypothetical protein B5G43_02395 [Flavonifractor sp. An92]|uniref:CCA tRNA nucleotidyltransferase n=1 Tax=Flavonifractor sp. An92 TaxID=1965666 RepID=UPI000B36C97B|nr:HD domain-containing protein [Flavonifractor sp. An92]OUN08251.1 hypothetical protein B5G43_02395 [Flavonifractor sp. An92]